MDSVFIYVNQKKSQISRHIYGHFAEHLGRCIYGGFWVGKDSPIAKPIKHGPANSLGTNTNIISITKSSMLISN